LPPPLHTEVWYYIAICLRRFEPAVLVSSVTAETRKAQTADSFHSEHPGGWVRGRCFDILKFLTGGKENEESSSVQHSKA